MRTLLAARGDVVGDFQSAQSILFRHVVEVGVIKILRYRILSHFARLFCHSGRISLIIILFLDGVEVVLTLIVRGFRLFTNH